MQGKPHQAATILLEAKLIMVAVAIIFPKRLPPSAGVKNALGIQERVLWLYSG
jgi:hypothetical protein